MGKEPIYWGGQIREIVVTAKNKYREKLLNMPPEYYVYNKPAWRDALKYMRRYGTPLEVSAISRKITDYNREKVSRQVLAGMGITVAGIFTISNGSAFLLSWGATPQAAVFAETTIQTVSSAARYTYEGAKIVGRYSLQYTKIGIQFLGHSVRVFGQKVVVHYSSPYPWLSMGANATSQAIIYKDMREINVVSVIGASFNPLLNAATNATEWRPFSQHSDNVYKSVFSNKLNTKKSWHEFGIDAGISLFSDKVSNNFFSKEAKIFFEPAKEFEKQATALGGQSLAKSVYELFIQEFSFIVKPKILNVNEINK